MFTWVVIYQNTPIRVIANNKRSARYRAWLKYKEAYPIDLIDFVKNVDSVVKEGEKI